MCAMECSFYQLSQQTIGTGIIIQSRSIFVKDSFTVLEPDLAALRLLGQVHNSRIASLLRHCSFVHHASASLYPALQALGSAPHDVNNVLCQLNQQTKRTGMRIHSRSIIVRDSFNQTDTGLPSLYGGNPSAS